MDIGLRSLSAEAAARHIREYLEHIKMSPTEFIRLSPRGRSLVLNRVYWEGRAEKQIGVQRELEAPAAAQRRRLAGHV
jgi:hypothetical protein